MENYIVIDGKRTELTDEQLQKLGIEVNNDPFDKVKRNEFFYYISSSGQVHLQKEEYGTGSNRLFEAANYCTDENLMEQRAVHETLNRLLWRFSMQNGGDELNWRNEFQNKWVINFNYRDNSFFIENKPQLRSFDPCFISQEIVERAINEIVKPFMEKHPDFVW